MKSAGATNEETQRHCGGGGTEGVEGDSRGYSGGLEAAWKPSEPPGEPFPTSAKLLPSIELPIVQVANIDSRIEDFAVNYLCDLYMSTYGSLPPGGCGIFRKQDPNTSPPSSPQQPHTRPPTQPQPQPNPKPLPAVPPSPPGPTPRVGKGGGRLGQKPPVEVETRNAEIMLNDKFSFNNLGDYKAGVLAGQQTAIESLVFPCARLAIGEYA